MRREGRPHGMVHTINYFPREPLNSQVVTPTAGFFVKVSPKPTNHSKFTGKCDRHSKSKNKSKGSYKLRSNDDKLSYKVIGWTVMAEDQSHKIPAVGYSASRILNDLDRDHLSSSYDDYDYDYKYDYDHSHGDEEDDENEKVSVEMEVCREVVVMDCDDDIVIHGGVMADGDDGYQGFYDISSVFCTIVDEDEDEDEDEDDGWSLVGGVIADGDYGF